MQRNAKQSKPGECLEAKSHHGHIRLHLPQQKKSFATAGMVPTKVRMRWCRAEELRSPEEERKEKEMDRACEGPLTSIYTLKASKLL